MSEFQHQERIGPQTFIAPSANGSLSGPDPFDPLDAGHHQHLHQHQSHQHQPHLFPDNEFTGHRALPHPLQTTSPEQGFGPGLFAYAASSSHNPSVSLAGLHYTSPIATTMTGHMATHYEHDPILEDLQHFSAISSAYPINPYRPPYPDSNATSTSSATSPEPAPGVMADPVIIEADEDKRKRNQAASARFRQKKKQREQQLLESSRDMQERSKKLEAENDGLKKENMFLKKLLVEKVDHMSDEDREMLHRVTREVLKKS